jgi:purine-binding chemotaxis protein CheW
VFELRREIFGVHALDVLEMVPVARLHSSPLAPAFVKGIMLLRQDTFPVLDLRVRLGMPGYTAEMVEMLHAREKDHVNWLRELESCVREDRSFTLAVDPRKCKFGQWYDQYRSDSLTLREHMKKFDAPHKAIHALASQAKALVDANRRDEAVALIDHARNRELRMMVDLFAEARNLLTIHTDGIVLVTKAGARKTGLLVDNVLDIQSFAEDAVSLPDETSLGESSRFLEGVARTHSNVCFLLNLPRVTDAAA